MAVAMKTPGHTLIIGPTSVDWDRREAYETATNIPILLRKAEWELFEILTNVAGQIVSYQEISDAMTAPRNSRQLQALASHLNKRLPKDQYGKKMVQAARAVGYRLPSALPAASIQQPVRVGPLMVDIGMRVVASAEDGKILKLTTSEYNLLELLIRKKGKVVSTNLLSKVAFRREWCRDDRSVHVAICTIRKKIASISSNLALILTEYSMGYYISTEIFA